MIVDIHTHIFPPRFIERRAELVARDPVFGALYGNPRATMATAEDLLTSMRDAGIDVSVACGFWWSDTALAAEHTAYLLEVAERSGGSIIAFVPARSADGLPPTAGIGEVREETAAAVPDLDLNPERTLLLHCSEEVGHVYPGKSGGLTPGALWELLVDRPQVRLIAAHWGGGFPFYGLMPEVRAVIDTGRLLFDTAASHYLYEPTVFARAIDLVGASAIAWGSDFPLRPQGIDLAEVRAALPDEEARALVLGGNAARFLGLPLGASIGAPHRAPIEA